MTRGFSLSLYVFLISMFAVPSMARANCPNGAAHTSGFCAVSGTTLTCNAAWNGGTGAVVLTAVYDNTESVCDEGYCIWGDDANGTDVCYEYAPSGTFSALTVNGGDGADLISFYYNPSGTPLQLKNWAPSSFTGTINGGTGLDTINGSDSVNSDYHDVLNGNDDADGIVGDNGNDTIYGGGGNDTITAGDGNDTISGNNGDDVIYCGTGDDNAHGDDGNDIIEGGAGADALHGDVGVDEIVGDAGNDSLYGGSDADELNGDGDNDNVHGDGGDDIVCAGTGIDHLTGDAGNDFLYGAPAGDDTSNGGAGTSDNCQGYGNPQVTNCEADQTTDPGCP